MPSRWVSDSKGLLRRLRQSPTAVAATAGGIGLVCGALVVAMTSVPSAVQSHAGLKPAAETSGSAASVVVKSTETPTRNVPVTNEPVADCDQQTWPHITQQCLTEREASQRKVRVIGSDRIAGPVVGAIEAERGKNSIRAAEQPRSAEVAVADNALPLALALVAPPPQAMPSESQTRAADIRERKMAAKRAAKSRHARTQQARQLTDDQARQLTDDEVATDTSRPSSRGRIVQHWTAREYEVPSESCGQRRRVIVRSGNDVPAGPFGSVFR